MPYKETKPSARQFAVKAIHEDKLNVRNPSILSGLLKAYAQQEVAKAEKWISVEDRTPIAYETGDWDGLRSDIVICQDEKEVYHIALLYEDRQGIVWYDQENFELTHKIVKWKSPPNH